MGAQGVAFAEGVVCDGCGGEGGELEVVAMVMVGDGGGDGWGHRRWSLQWEWCAMVVAVRAVSWRW